MIQWIIRLVLKQYKKNIYNNKLTSKINKLTSKINKLKSKINLYKNEIKFKTFLLNEYRNHLIEKKEMSWTIYKDLKYYIEKDLL